MAEVQRSVKVCFWRGLCPFRVVSGVGEYSLYCLWSYTPDLSGCLGDTNQNFSPGLS